MAVFIVDEDWLLTRIKENMDKAYFVYESSKECILQTNIDSKFATIEDEKYKTLRAKRISDNEYLISFIDEKK